MNFNEWKATNKIEKLMFHLNRDGLWYRNEVIDALEMFGCEEYIDAVKDNGMCRWYPNEVLNLILEEDRHRKHIADGLPVVDASEKHIPDFLLKSH